MQDWRTHDGLDIAAAIGTQVRAAANGRVTDVYADDAYGTTVVISHNGWLCSVYSNLAATPTVAVGDTVGVGQVIGAVGDTALAEIGEPAHLHFAMTCGGESIDPGEYMP
ncbi:MAG: M23 family metallopeptidase [Oscillospiraceae bacterium]|nr:M23 family metallopeptidase [Oscillospiraceae bacterium]